MELVLTAKVKIVPTEEQHTMLQQTLQAYREGCNYLSGVIYTTKNLIQARLHTTTYRYLGSVPSSGVNCLSAITA